MSEKILATREKILAAREKILVVRGKNFSCERKILVECCIKNYKRPLGKKRKFTILKIRHVTVRSSLGHKQCDVIGDLRILKPWRT